MKIKVVQSRLHNFILPLIFFEWWHVLMALIFVVLIESFIVKLFVSEKFSRLFSILFKANLITTFLGYLLQGIVRFLIGAVIYMATGKNFNPIIRGIFGNVSIGNKQSAKFDIAAISEIITSILICLVLSVIIERKVVRKALKDRNNDMSISKSILIANIVSYLILTLWIFYNFYQASK